MINCKGIAGIFRIIACNNLRYCKENNRDGENPHHDIICQGQTPIMTYSLAKQGV